MKYVDFSIKPGRRQVERYIEAASRSVGKMKACMTCEDIDTLLQEARWLKNDSHFAGAKVVYRLCSEIESAFVKFKIRDVDFFLERLDALEIILPFTFRELRLSASIMDCWPHEG